MPDDPIEEALRDVPLEIGNTVFRTPLSDVWNAETLETLYGNNLHYCASLGGWFLWIIYLANQISDNCLQIASPIQAIAADVRRVGQKWLIPLVLQVAMGQREKLLVFGNDYPTPDGTCIRDYIHVDDLAQAHLLAIGVTEPGRGAVYNVGTGTGNSVLEVIGVCEAAVGSRIPYEIVDRRPGDAPALVADPNRIMSKLGWKPQFTEIRQIAQTAWQWHKRYPEGYRTKEAKLAAR